MATADKLNKLIETKANIKEAIKAKGVTVNDSDTFASYPSKIASISGGGSSKFIVPEGMKFAYSTFNEFNTEQYDVSNVTDMSNMFRECFSMRNIDLSTWNMVSVIDMSYMFMNCGNLQNVVLPQILSVYDTSYMFSSCSYLYSIDLSGLYTGYLITMESMFNGCANLKELRLTGLGENNDCIELDLSSCYNLTKESVLYLFENAFDRAAAGYTNPFTITLHPDTKALLTEEEIAIATNKGFTVV